MRHFLLLLLLLINHHCSFAQNQSKIDSLLFELSSTSIDSARATILFDISEKYWFNNLTKGIDYANQSLEIAKRIEFKKGIVNGYFSLANLYLNKANFPLAKECCDKTLLLADEKADAPIIAMTYANLGFILANMGNLNEAQKYCFTAIQFSEKINYQKGVIVAYSNLGTVYYVKENDKEALKNYETALRLAQKDNYKLYMAANYHNIAMLQVNDTEAIKNTNLALSINHEMGNKLWEAYNYNLIGYIVSNSNKTESIKYFQATIDIAKKIDEYLIISTGLNNIGEIYREQKNYLKAKKYFEESLSYQEKANYISGMPVLYGNLASIDTIVGDWKSAFKNQSMQMLFQDSILNDENTKKMIQASMQFDFDKKEAVATALQEKKDAVAEKELQKQKLVRNGFIGGFGFVALFAGVFFTQRNKIKKGKKRSDALLLNILPEEVAEELKAKGSADAQLIDHVTVLFTDFKGFTAMSEKVTPKQLVADLHECFSAFDQITEKYRLEKIKTIGDAYMAAGGLPTPNKTHASDAVKAAMEMRDFIEEGKRKKIAEGIPYFEIRIGIHTGPVVAGIVGVKKFQYDIWGDTVNTASRMESSGEAGQINISETTYELVKDEFVCEPRGKVQAKGKGEMEMYFVNKRAA